MEMSAAPPPVIRSADMDTSGELDEEPLPPSFEVSDTQTRGSD